MMNGVGTFTKMEPEDEVDSCVPVSVNTLHNGGAVRCASHSQAVIVRSQGRSRHKENCGRPDAPKHVSEICRVMAVYIAHHFTNNNKKLDGKTRMYQKHANTLKRTVNELSHRHAILLNSMVKKLEINRNNMKDVFEDVADEIFIDNVYNWGRLVSLYAFGGRLAKYCLDNNITDDVETVAEFVGNYVSSNLAWWIHKSGGWVGTNSYSPTTVYSTTD